jgi:hypothetical protein
MELYGRICSIKKKNADAFAWRVGGMLVVYAIYCSLSAAVGS